MSERPKIILGRTFLNALCAAGVIAEEDRIRRVVIDASYDDVVALYVERVGDERVLEVASSLNGTEIRGVPGNVVVNVGGDVSPEGLEKLREAVNQAHNLGSRA